MLLFALLATQQIGMLAPESRVSPWVWFSFIFAQAVLVLVGADRRHKFDMEVETTIIAAFLKNCQASKKPANNSTPTPKPTTTDLIRAELQKAKIVQNTNYSIEPGDDTATK
jgi:hypothetical protein